MTRPKPKSQNRNRETSRSGPCLRRLSRCLFPNHVATAGMLALLGLSMSIPMRVSGEDRLTGKTAEEEAVIWSGIFFDPSIRAIEMNRRWLESTVIEKVAFDDLPVREVMSFLEDHSAESGPEGTGLTFSLATLPASVQMRPISMEAESLSLAAILTRISRETGTCPLIGTDRVELVEKGHEIPMFSRALEPEPDGSDSPGEHPKKLLLMSGYVLSREPLTGSKGLPPAEGTFVFASSEDARKALLDDDLDEAVRKYDGIAMMTYPADSAIEDFLGDRNLEGKFVEFPRAYADPGTPLVMAKNKVAFGIEANFQPGATEVSLRFQFRRENEQGRAEVVEKTVDVQSGGALLISQSASTEGFLNLLLFPVLSDAPLLGEN